MIIFSNMLILFTRFSLVKVLVVQNTTILSLQKNIVDISQRYNLTKEFYRFFASIYFHEGPKQWKFHEYQF